MALKLPYLGKYIRDRYVERDLEPHKQAMVDEGLRRAQQEDQEKVAFSFGDLASLPGRATRAAGNTISDMQSRGVGTVLGDRYQAVTGERPGDTMGRVTGPIGRGASAIAGSEWGRGVKAMATEPRKAFGALGRKLTGAGQKSTRPSAAEAAPSFSQADFAPPKPAAPRKAPAKAPAATPKPKQAPGPTGAAPKAGPKAGADSLYK